MKKLWVALQSIKSCIGTYAKLAGTSTEGVLIH